MVVSSGSAVTEIPADALDGGLSQRFSGFDGKGNPEGPLLNDSNLPGSGLDLDSAISDGDLESHPWRDSRLVANRFR